MTHDHEVDFMWRGLYYMLILLYYCYFYTIIDGVGRKGDGEEESAGVDVEMRRRL